MPSLARPVAAVLADTLRATLARRPEFTQWTSASGT